MKYNKKMNRYEKRQMQSDNLKAALAGKGLYLYENNSDADLTLPRPTNSGRREIGPREQFQADDYFLQLVRTGNLKLIKELQSPNQEEATMEKEEKLILDQPDTVTNEGTVENVAQPGEPCSEGDACCGGGTGNQPDVLINESPADDDGFVILED